MYKRNLSLKLAMVLVSTVFVLQACNNPASMDNSVDGSMDSMEKGKPASTFVPDFALPAAACEVNYDLTAGQHIVMGNVTLSVSGDSLTLTYDSGSWSLDDTKVQIDADVPKEKGAPGRYAHGKTSHASGTSSFSYQYLLSDLGFAAGDVFFVRAHADVTGGSKSEGAYGGTIQKPRGAWYGIIAFEIPAETCGGEDDDDDDGDDDDGDDDDDNGPDCEADPFQEGCLIVF